MLRESKELDKDKCGLVSDYSQKLIDIYERTGDQVSYRKELLWNIFHCGQSDLERLMRLKKYVLNRNGTNTGRNIWSSREESL